MAAHLDNPCRSLREHIAVLSARHELGYPDTIGWYDRIAREREQEERLAIARAERDAGEVAETELELRYAYGDR